MVAGDAGAVCLGAGLAPSMTELPRSRVVKIDSEKEVSMKITAAPVVSLERNVAVPRAPKAV